MAAPLTIGRYCRFCGFLEDAEDIDIDRCGPCEACGCAQEHHIAAEVVTGFDPHHLEPPKENTR